MEYHWKCYIVLQDFHNHFELYDLVIENGFNL